MSTPPDWHELLGAIYDAAMDDALWTPVVGRIMENVGASGYWMLSPIINAVTPPFAARPAHPLAKRKPCAAPCWV